MTSPAFQARAIRTKPLSIVSGTGAPLTFSVAGGAVSRKR